MIRLLAVLYERCFGSASNQWHCTAAIDKGLQLDIMQRGHDTACHIDRSLASATKGLQFRGWNSELVPSHADSRKAPWTKEVEALVFVCL